MVLDSINGLYAIIGILSVCYSFVFLACDGKLEIRGNGILLSTWTGPRKVTIPILDKIPELLSSQSSWSSLIFEQLVWAMWPTKYMQGQVLLEKRSARRIALLMGDSISKSVPVVLSLIINVAVMVASMGSSGQRLIHRYIRRRRHQDVQMSAFWFVLYAIAPFMVGCTMQYVLSYLFAFGYELYVIRYALEAKTWGSDKWRWYDPWSDFFVY